MFFLTGVARYLFVPMAEAVVSRAGVVFAVANAGADDGDVLLRGHEHDTHKAPTTFLWTTSGPL